MDKRDRISITNEKLGCIVIAILKDIFRLEKEDYSEDLLKLLNYLVVENPTAYTNIYKTGISLHQENKTQRAYDELYTYIDNIEIPPYDAMKNYTISEEDLIKLCYHCCR